MRRARKQQLENALDARPVEWAERFNPLPRIERCCFNCGRVTSEFYPAREYGRHTVRCVPCHEDNLRREIRDLSECDNPVACSEV